MNKSCILIYFFIGLKRLMKLVTTKLALVVIAAASILSGCTGTTYNRDRTCSTDYLLVPAISISAAIGACDSHNATNK